jgi:hypothetical protein
MTIPCPECNITTGKVLDSRVRGNGTRRRRECANGHRFSTFEVVVPDLIKNYTVEVKTHKNIKETKTFSVTTIQPTGRPKRVASGKPKKTILTPQQQATLDKLKAKIAARKKNGN